MNSHNQILTEDEFLKKEIVLWGENYIFDLVDRGYTLKLTTAGWRWILPASVPVVTAGMQFTAVDTDSSLCYDGAVGVG